MTDDIVTRLRNYDWRKATPDRYSPAPMMTEMNLQYKYTQMSHDRDYWRGKCEEVLQIMSAYEHTTDDAWIKGIVKDLKAALG